MRILPVNVCKTHMVFVCKMHRMFLSSLLIWEFSVFSMFRTLSGVLGVLNTGNRICMCRVYLNDTQAICTGCLYDGAGDWWVHMAAYAL